MKKIFTFGKPLILHPLFFAIYPLIFLFSFNLEKGESVSFFNFLPFILISIGITVFLLIIFTYSLGNGKKAGILVSIILALFFLYGHSIIFLEDQGLFSEDDTSLGLYPHWLAIFLFSVICTIRAKSNLNKLTIVLNVTAGVLLLFPLFSITAYKFQTWPSISKSAQKVEIKLKNPPDLVKRPDIYYVIPDGYGGRTILEKFYNFNNQQFIGDLEERGFFVAKNSFSNYSSTAESMASSMNMLYLTDSGEFSRSPLEKKTEEFVHEDLLRDIPSGTSNVKRIIESIGYEYKYISSNKLKQNRKANSIMFGILLDELLILVLETTLLRDFIPEIVLDDYSTKIKKTFIEIASSKAIEDKPMFVLAHIMIPHPPFVFGVDGENANNINWTQWGIDSWADKKGYINQLIYTNKLIIEMIDNIIAKTKTSPIIIIQGDHGPASSFKAKNSWSNPENNMIKERLSILNAYYLPNGGNKMLYNSITPVNTFRVIFNQYFDKDYDLLEDKSFWKDFYFNRENTTYVDVSESAYGKINIISNESNYITNGNFNNNIIHWRVAVPDGGHNITWSDGALKFTQGKESFWIHSFQNVGYLEAGESYRISIKCTDSSANMRLGVGTKEPTAKNAYWGSAKIDGQWYAQIGTEKEYILNVTPTTDGPHYIVISDGGGAGSISKFDDLTFFQKISGASKN